MLNRPAYSLQEIRLAVVSTSPKGVVHIDAGTEVELRAEYEEPREARRADVTYDDLGARRHDRPGARDGRAAAALSRAVRAAGGGAAQGACCSTGRRAPARPALRARSPTRATPSSSSSTGRRSWARPTASPNSSSATSSSRRRRRRPRSSSSTRSIRSRPNAGRCRARRRRGWSRNSSRLMDGLEKRANVVVIAATNRPEAIDEALRRPGRFDREIVIGVPDERGRREILGIHTRGMPLADGVDLQELARTTYGFVGADVAALAREAAIEAVRRIMPRLDLSERTIPPEVLDDLRVTREDFLAALKRVQPSAMREVMVQAPNVGWDDVGGLDAARERLREGVELPLKHPDSFRRIGIRPAKGFLLYGPPGTGKTLLAKAVAREAQANFIATKSSDLLSKWYGESEQQIARLFARARQVAPTVIFIDELDSLVPARGGGLGEPAVTERVVNTILSEMDGLEELQSVVVVGATNRPNLIDPALLRPGRFDELVYVGVPDEAGRRRILGIHTAEMPLADDVDLDALAGRTARFTGADLEDLARRAGLTALRRSIDAPHVTMADFEAGLDDMRASVTAEMERDYEQMAARLKQDALAIQPIGFIAPGVRE
ncbi:hypothetical protein SLE2022_405730 [Rubroshorea leprosula]